MASYNKVILMGNLTRDPELKTIPSGSSVCAFSLAVSRTFRTQDGNSREETAFLDCEAWGRTGETISRYCTKGRPLLVEGRLRQDSWDDKETGKKRSKIVVVVETFQFVGSRTQGEGGEAAPGAPAPRRASSAPASREAPAPQKMDDLEDEVPF